MDKWQNYATFIAENRIRDILTGQSSAVVCEIKGHRVAKWVRRRELKQEGLWEKYLHEAAFYRHVQNMQLSFVPKAEYADSNADEMLLIMKKYTPLNRNRLSDELLEKAAETLANIHAMPLPAFLSKPELQPLVHKADDTEGYLAGWKSVLNEHGNAFSAKELQAVVRDINSINAAFCSKRQCFTHGDFHFDNLLADENGGLVVCDWQGCGCGDPSGDVSFLISRLLADGYPLDEKKLVESYCGFANQKGLDVQPEEVEMQMCLSNLNISFMYWHHYLHGSEEERVRGIYEKMLGDYQCLTDRM